MKTTPEEALKEARRNATAHGMFVVDKAGAYVLYRKTAVRLVYLGQRSTPAALRSFVSRCAAQ